MDLDNEDRKSRKISSGFFTPLKPKLIVSANVTTKFLLMKKKSEGPTIRLSTCEI